MQPVSVDVNRPQQPSTLPLGSFYSPGRADNITLLAPNFPALPGLLAGADFGPVRIEGYVYSSEQANTANRQLRQFWNGSVTNNALVGTAAGISQLTGGGYFQSNTEGYAFPAQ